MSATIYLGLGSNLGDRSSLLKHACQELQHLPLKDFQESSIYESEPYQGMEQPLYYNQVVRGMTSLTPRQLLETCLEIEKRLGRKREYRWESRLIDIDILYYDDLVLDSEELIIPHHDLVNRGFFLLPLFELAPDWTDPRAQQTVDRLLQHWKARASEPMPVCIH
ncbi:MAG: 2-amino-4-hydroxy-6-hydroxymethyldihydropteridine diphosphokinase [SAR324 cluster bacterium]|nr:2-amino-4-hydroxy-6-hydroxymethyldihydropteridine diphosphokinase [SAR324 cluster bacterium]